jgi:predicted HAD superfamily phosphohydrolase YqeG
MWRGFCSMREAMLLAAFAIGPLIAVRLPSGSLGRTRVHRILTSFLSALQGLGWRSWSEAKRRTSDERDEQGTQRLHKRERGLDGWLVLFLERWERGELVQLEPALSLPTRPLPSGSRSGSWVDRPPPSLLPVAALPKRVRPLPIPAHEAAYVRAYADGLSVLELLLERAPPGQHAARKGREAVFLDIDETLVRPHTKLCGITDAGLSVRLGFPRPPTGVGEHAHLSTLQGYYQSIEPVCELARHCRAHGLRVVLLTARRESEGNRLWTAGNLRALGVAFDELHYAGDVDKAGFRRRWCAEADGCEIVLTVGDRCTDVLGAKEGGYSSILLPSRTQGEQDHPYACEVRIAEWHNARQ